MSFEKAKSYLLNKGFTGKILTFKEETATVLQAANAVGCSQGEIAKTLSFLVGDSAIVIVVAGNCKINNNKYKSEFGVKAKMVPYEQVENLIGYSVGGVCPFGVNKQVKIYLDESLKKYNVVYPACGDCHSAVEIFVKNFENLVNVEKWVDVCSIIE